MHADWVGGSFFLPLLHAVCHSRSRLPHPVLHHSIHHLVHIYQHWPLRTWPCVLWLWEHPLKLTQCRHEVWQWVAPGEDVLHFIPSALQEWFNAECTAHLMHPIDKWMENITMSVFKRCLWWPPFIFIDLEISIEMKFKIMQTPITKTFNGIHIKILDLANWCTCRLIARTVTIFKEKC